MYKLLKIVTEVNELEVTVFGKCFLEYPDKEIYDYLKDQAEEIVSKLINISKFKLNENFHYTWGWEDFDENKHSNLNILDLDDVYKPVFKHSKVEESENIRSSIPTNMSKEEKFKYMLRSFLNKRDLHENIYMRELNLKRGFMETQAKKANFFLNDAEVVDDFVNTCRSLIVDFI